MGKRWALARDKNEREIKEALERAGCTVLLLEGGPHTIVLDLLVGYWEHRPLGSFEGKLTSQRRSWMQIEVKNLEARRPGDAIKVADIEPGGQYEAVLDYCNRRTAIYLKPGQAKLLCTSTAPMAVVTTPDEALRAVGILPEGSRTVPGVHDEKD